MMKNLGTHIIEPISVMCDNTSTINISKNPIMHSRMKHIAIPYHLLKEKVEEGEVNLEFILTSKKVMDINHYPRKFWSTHERNWDW